MCGSHQRIVCLLLLLVLTTTFYHPVYGQRFLRQGFSNNEDFGSEMKLDENDSNNAFDMTREMFLMQDLMWQIQPPIVPLQLRETIPNPILRKHIQKYINTNQPIDIRLLKKRGKFGLRAVGRTADGKKLRAFWRQSVVPPIGPPPSPSSQQGGISTKTTTMVGTPQRGIDFLKASYDDACRTRLFTVEFELQLPPVSKKDKNVVLPSIIYQVSLEPGSMNPKALVPRSAGRIFIYPTGRTPTTSSSRPSGMRTNMKYDKIEVGKAYISAAPMKPGIVDPSWAKGRPIFRKGRNSGLM